MSETLYLLAEAGGHRFALDASLVDSVVAGSDIVPVPLSDPHIAGLSALRSRVITVIDTMAAIENRQASLSGETATIVVNLDEQLLGLCVDDVHDVVRYQGEQTRLGAAFEPGWRRVSTGIIEIDGKAIVVVDPVKLVEIDDRMAA